MVNTSIPPLVFAIILTVITVIFMPKELSWISLIVFGIGFCVGDYIQGKIIDRIYKK